VVPEKSSTLAKSESSFRRVFQFCWLCKVSWSCGKSDRRASNAWITRK